MYYTEGTCVLTTCFHAIGIEFHKLQLLQQVFTLLFGMKAKGVFFCMFIREYTVIKAKKNNLVFRATVLKTLGRVSSVFFKN